MGNYFQQHDIQVLHQDQYGYVVRCVHCRCIQIAFNNIAIDQDLSEFHSMVQVIDTYYREHCHGAGQECHLRNIFVDTPFEKFRLIFSFTELHKLHNMLQKVRLMLEVDDISRAQ